MSIGITITGIPEVSQFLKNVNNKIEKAETEGVQKAAVYVQGQVKKSIAGRSAEPTSVDTGHFMGNIEFQAGKTEAQVFTNVPYAKFLEYGTSKIRARPHFRNSKARSQDKVTSIIKDAISKAI